MLRFPTERTPLNTTHGFAHDHCFTIIQLHAACEMFNVYENDGWEEHAASAARATTELKASTTVRLCWLAALEYIFLNESFPGTLPCDSGSSGGPMRHVLSASLLAVLFATAGCVHYHPGVSTSPYYTSYFNTYDSSRHCYYHCCDYSPHGYRYRHGGNGHERLSGGREHHASGSGGHQSHGSNGASSHSSHSGSSSHSSSSHSGGSSGSGHAK